MLVRGLKRLTLKRALEWCLKNNTFLFNGQLYKQIDGIAMGSPLAPVLADIFMNHLIEGHVKSRTSDWENMVVSDGLCDYAAKLFCRYVDDILACFNNQAEADRFLVFLNSLHPNIKFTVEYESDFGRIPFLDLFIIKTDVKLDITVYRKPTHSGVYTHFASFLPTRLKRQLVVTLLERAYKICSGYELLHREFEDLKRLLMRNGYNEDYILSIINSFMSSKYNHNQGKRFGPDKYKIFISLPYIGEASEKIRGNINSCLSQMKCGGIQLVLIDKFSRVGDWFQAKDRQPLRLVNGVVYKIACSCGCFYIGETGRCLQTRFDEHCKTTGKSLTEVGKHLKENPGHSICFDTQVSALGRCNFTSRRKFLETLHLQDHKRDPGLLNDMLKSKPLYLFNV